MATRRMVVLLGRDPETEVAREWFGDRGIIKVVTERCIGLIAVPSSQPDRVVVAEFTPTKVRYFWLPLDEFDEAQRRLADRTEVESLKVALAKTFSSRNGVEEMPINEFSRYFPELVQIITGTLP